MWFENIVNVIRQTEKYNYVSGFTNKLGKPIRVPVMDTSVVYECNRIGMVYILVMRNDLFVPEIETCLIHLIVTRLVGIKVDKIQQTN